MAIYKTCKAVFNQQKSNYINHNIQYKKGDVILLGRINSYTKITRPVKTDVAILDGASGTRTVTLSDLAVELGGMISVDQHRNIYRGKSLGSSFTDAQKTAISDGTFDDLYVGDYWTISSIVYRIADIDYWYGQGESACTKHHLVIMPDKHLYSGKMNGSGSTEGGYVNSEMYKTGLEDAKTTIKSAFGSANVLSHRLYLTNAVTDGHASGAGWFDSEVEIPNEIQMYGSNIRANRGDGSSTVYLGTIDNTQLALMRLNPRMINPSMQNQWLRDIISSTSFANVNVYGNSASNTASNSGGVRPVFGVTG